MKWSTNIWGLVYVQSMYQDGLPRRLSGKESTFQFRRRRGHGFSPWVWSLDQEDPLEKGTATRSSVIAWKIPWIEESMGVQKSWPWLSDWIHTHIHTQQSVLLFPNSFISHAKNFRLDGRVDRLPPPKPKARTMFPGDILKTHYSGVKPGVKCLSYIMWLENAFIGIKDTLNQRGTFHQTLAIGFPLHQGKPMSLSSTWI